MQKCIRHNMSKSTIPCSENGKLEQKQKGRTSECTITSTSTPFEEKRKIIEFILLGENSSFTSTFLLISTYPTVCTTWRLSNFIYIPYGLQMFYIVFIQAVYVVHSSLRITEVSLSLKVIRCIQNTSGNQKKKSLIKKMKLSFSIFSKILYCTRSWWHSTNDIEFGQ